MIKPDANDQGVLPPIIRVPVCAPPVVITEQVGPLPLVAPLVVVLIVPVTVVVPDCRSSCGLFNLALVDVALPLSARLPFTVNVVIVA